MALPELRGTVTDVLKTKTNSVTVTLPEGLTAGDLLIIAVAYSKPEGGTLPTSTLWVSEPKPTALTLGAEISQAENQRITHIYYMVYAGGEVNANPTGGGAATYTMDIMAIGIKKGTYNEAAPFNVKSTSWLETTSTTTGKISGITPTIKETLEFAYATGASVGTAITAGWTEAKATANHTFWDKTNATTESLGTFEYKKSSTKNTSGYRFAIAPAQSGLSMML